MQKLRWVALILATTISSSVLADIHMPDRPGPTRKLSSGIAKVAFSGAYVLDSFYTRTVNEGGTVGYTYGLIEGTSKAITSTGLGVAEIATFPVRPYKPLNRKYDFPPADLKNFW